MGSRRQPPPPAVATRWWPDQRSESLGARHALSSPGPVARTLGAAPPRRSAAGSPLGAVGVGAGAGQLAAVDDQVLVRDRAVVEPALQDLAGAGGVAGLGRQAGARGVWGHTVVGHGPPGMILRSGLGVPDIAGVAGELARLERPHDRVAVADLAARGVDEVCAAAHCAEELVV